MGKNPSIAELLALILGDMDLVRPVGEAGVSCAVVAHRTDPTRWSKFTKAVIDADAPGLLDRMLEFGHTCDNRPVIFYEADWSLQLVSEHRETLGEVFRFVVPERADVERLLSKARFRELAEQVGLPVPRSQSIEPREGDPPPDLSIPFPLIVKPVPGRDDAWDASFGRSRKAVRVDDRAGFERVWPSLTRRGGEVLLQELIPGPESRIESYHAYVKADGETVGEFTGRKIRTFPVEYGASCALETTDAPDVVAAGRDFVQRTGYRGVLKADFKRRPDASLALLEVNPRFSLWHSLGAAAGVNIPAIVLAELTGGEPPEERTAKVGVTWCDPPADLKAARELGIGRARWLRWVVSECDVHSATSVRDPLPFIRRLLPGG